MAQSARPIKLEQTRRPWTIGRTVWEIVLFLIICTALVPVLWGFFLSVKTNQEIMLDPFGMPAAPRWDNYLRAYKGVPYGRMLLNTGFAVIIAVPCSIVVNVMAAFAIGRMRVGRGRMQNALYRYFIAGVILPGYVMLFPIYIMSVKLGLYNSLWSVILPAMGGGASMGMMLLCANFRAVPVELDEAAIVDGCGMMRLLVQVLVPVISPAIATLTILNFLGVWNNFVMARVLLAKEELRMISQAVLYFKGEYATDYALTMAGTMTLIIPQLIVFTALQKYIVAGVTTGAVKG